ACPRRRGRCRSMSPTTCGEPRGHGHRRAESTLRSRVPRRLKAVVGGYPVLLLFVDRDVVHGLTLSVSAFCRDGHRFAVLRDDPRKDYSHLTVLLVSAFRGPCVDSLE